MSCITKDFNAVIESMCGVAMKELREEKNINQNYEENHQSQIKSIMFFHRNFITLDFDDDFQLICLTAFLRKPNEKKNRLNKAVRANEAQTSI